MVDMAKKWWGAERFHDMDLGEIQEWTHITPEKLTEDDVMEMSASKPVPDYEEQDMEEVCQKTSWHQTDISLAEGFWLLKTTFDFF